MRFCQLKNKKNVRTGDILTFFCLSYQIILLLPDLLLERLEERHPVERSAERFQ